MATNRTNIEGGMMVHTPIVVDFGGAPYAQHDYACPIYPDAHAVLHLDTGIFHPSWIAQRHGYVLLEIRPKWLRKLLQAWFRPKAPRVAGHLGIKDKE